MLWQYLCCMQQANEQLNLCYDQLSFQEWWTEIIAYLEEHVGNCLQSFDAKLKGAEGLATICFKVHQYLGTSLKQDLHTPLTTLGLPCFIAVEDVNGTTLVVCLDKGGADEVMAQQVRNTVPCNVLMEALPK
jgi:hypothetical protein